MRQAVCRGWEGHSDAYVMSVGKSLLCLGASTTSTLMLRVSKEDVRIVVLAVVDIVLSQGRRVELVQPGGKRWWKQMMGGHRGEEGARRGSYGPLRLCLRALCPTQLASTMGTYKFIACFCAARRKATFVRLQQKLLIIWPIYWGAQVTDE